MLPHLLVLTAVVAVSYVPPVDAPVVDGFRPPSSAYAAGNRGIDYETSPGAAARAAAGGTVVFAGRIGGSTHVVVLHADGVRTTYRSEERREGKSVPRLARSIIIKMM